MDQTKTSGIGNYILAEALYRARVHPFARVGDLDEEMIADLYTEIRDISNHSFASQQEGMQTRAKRAKGCGAGYIHSGSSSRQFEFKLLVYGQKSDPLGHRVRREEGAHGRTIHWVPEVQTRGAPAP